MTLARYVYTPDPQEGTLLTPVNNSTVVKFFLENLPINRQGLDPLTRGLEIGMAHGYFIFGPFAVLGPLRNFKPAGAEFAGILQQVVTFGPINISFVGALTGLGSAIGLILIAMIGLSSYASMADDVPEFSREGWSRLSAGFLIGGVGGALFAFLLVVGLPLFSAIATIK
jgi:hypothetical protein